MQDRVLKHVVDNVHECHIMSIETINVSLVVIKTYVELMFGEVFATAIFLLKFFISVLHFS